ncbi:hypothetical protein SAMN02799638_01713 [Arthrobacter sp. UNCCL28]|nr:hypothetical protein SAMN02799638_01713 [Arthrobacter sp. UNCCL28]
MVFRELPVARRQARRLRPPRLLSQSAQGPAPGGRLLPPAVHIQHSERVCACTYLFTAAPVRGTRAGCPLHVRAVDRQDKGKHLYAVSTNLYVLSPTVSPRVHASLAEPASDLPPEHPMWPLGKQSAVKQNTPRAVACGVSWNSEGLDQPLTRMKTGPEPTLTLNSAVVDPFHPPWTAWPLPT